MEQLRCSEDSFDAIYICSSCTNIMLCPKHYFSHKQQFSDHEIDHIKISVNNDSRQILVNFVINLKKKLISIIYNIDIELWAKYSEDNGDLMKKINTVFRILNLSLKFLTKVQHIPIKVFYTSFEYFLREPPDKAFKFINEFKFPESLEEFISASYWDSLFLFNYFNYFSFEDKKYISGWWYAGEYNNLNLGGVCFAMLCHFLLNSEYEMAYSVLDNLKKIYEIRDKELVSFFSSILEFIHEFIKKRNISELIEKWKYLEKSLSKYYKFSLPLYELSECLFKGLNLNELFSHCLKKKEIIFKNKHPELKLKYKALLPVLHNYYGNYELAKKYSKNIPINPESYDRSYLKHWIYSWAFLLREKLIFSKKQINTVKIVKNITKVVDSVVNNHDLYENLLILNFTTWNFDPALKIAFRLLKLYKENKKTLISSPASIYLCIGLIYFIKNDLKKALCFLCNAKSCIGVLGQDISQDIIYFHIGVVYFAKGCFKDALDNFERINSSSFNWTIFQTAKIHIGAVYWMMQDYEKALKCYIDIEKTMPSGNTEIFSHYANIGQLYELAKDLNNANVYYNKAFCYIPASDKFPFAIHPAINKIFSYFLKKCEYEKCKAILESKKNCFKVWILERFIGLKSILFIQWWKLCLAQNKIVEANKYRFEVEKLLDIEKCWVLRKEFENSNILKTFLKLASIYTFKVKDFFKAEKICKTIESGLDVNLPVNARYFWKLFRNLLEIYRNQERWVEAQEYNKKLLELLKKSDQNEHYRFTICLKSAEIKKNISENELLAEKIDKHLEISIE